LGKITSLKGMVNKEYRTRNFEGIRIASILKNHKTEGQEEQEIPSREYRSKKDIKITSMKGMVNKEYRAGNIEGRSAGLIRMLLCHPLYQRAFIE